MVVDNTVGVAGNNDCCVAENKDLSFGNGM
jgi:hypothetical protein